MIAKQMSRMSQVRNVTLRTSTLPQRYIITINVLLILKMRESIFFCGQITLWSIPRDILRGPRLLSSKFQFRGQKRRGPLKISRKMAHKVICPKTKIISQISCFRRFFWEGAGNKVERIHIIPR
jgi:hypothetical protein